MISVKYDVENPYGISYAFQEDDMPLSSIVLVGDGSSAVGVVSRTFETPSTSFDVAGIVVFKGDEESGAEQLLTEDAVYILSSSVDGIDVLIEQLQRAKSRLEMKQQDKENENTV